MTLQGTEIDAGLNTNMIKYTPHTGSDEMKLNNKVKVVSNSPIHSLANIRPSVFSMHPVV